MALARKVLRTAFLRKYWQTAGLSELAYSSNYVLLQMYSIKISLGCSKSKPKMDEIPNRKEAHGRAVVSTDIHKAFL